MSKVLVTESHLNNIAEAIRAKNGASTTYRPGDMAAAIQAIPTGGITPTGTKQITQNGTHDVTQYANANVNVQPNLQSKTATENGTITPDQGYDGLSSVVVNVSGGGGSDGVYVGTGEPDASIGSNGDYYYKRKRTGMYGYTSTPGNSSSTSQTGYEFIANEAIAISGLRAYNTNTSGTINLLLGKLDGSVLGRIDNVQVNGGWVEASFDTEVQLVAGEHYIVQAIRNGQGFRYQSKSSTTFNSKITGVQGRYGGLPGSTDSGNIYSADIIISSDTDVYVVTRQYFKSSGVWEVIV